MEELEREIDMKIFTMAQCREDHPVFFKNIKTHNRGSMLRVNIASSIYSRTRCFITEETLILSGGRKDHSFKVWRVPENKEHAIKLVGRFTNVHDARDAAREGRV